MVKAVRPTRANFLQWAPVAPVVVLAGGSHFANDFIRGTLAIRHRIKDVMGQALLSGKLALAASRGGPHTATTTLLLFLD